MCGQDDHEALPVQIPRSKTNESLEVVKVFSVWLAAMSGAEDTGSYLSTGNDHQEKLYGTVLQYY